MQIKANTITEAYYGLLVACSKFGRPVESRGMPVIEVPDVELRIKDVSQPFVLQKARKLNYPYCILEPIMLTRPQTLATVDACCFYVGKFLRKHVVNPETQVMDGWYGDRLNYIGENQLLNVYRLLKEDPGTRRAIITIHNSKEEQLRPNSLDIPCTLDIQFLIREGHLHCYVNMRGNDAMLGTPQNFAMWSFMQRMLAAWLEIPAGEYFHRVAAMHVYERDIEKAKKIIETGEELIDKPEITERDWSWPISDPIESLRQCELFALGEQLYRTTQRKDIVQLACKRLDNSLMSILEEVMFPYIDNKLAKTKR